MSIRFKAIISILLVMLVWGSSFAVTKNAVQHIPPLTFAFLRFAIASATLQLMLVFRKKQLSKTGKIPFIPIFWMGLTGVGLFYIFFNYSLVYTSASMGALIQAFIPVIITILAAIFLKERITWPKIASIIISIAGVVLVAFLAQPDSHSSNPLLGNIFMLIAVSSWGVYTVISKKVAELDILKVTCYSTYIGTLLLIPSVLIELWHRPLPVISLQDWISAFYLGVLGSAISYFLYNRSLKALPASMVGIFINLDPVIGAAIAVIFLHEHITMGQLAGTVLVLAGMWLSTKTENDDG